MKEPTNHYENAFLLFILEENHEMVHVASVTFLLVELLWKVQSCTFSRFKN